MAEKKTITLEVVVDDKGAASVKILTDSIDKLNKTQKKSNETTKSAQTENGRLAKQIEKLANSKRRTIEVIQQEIKLRKQLIQRVATTNEGYLKGTMQVMRLEKELKDLTKTQSAFNASSKLNAKNMGSVRSATGNATGMMVELGRTISDANYGITGMANNLQQLASTFILTTRGSGGFMGAIKDLGKSFMGVGGILVIISTAITLFERYAMKQREAKKATEDFNNEISKRRGAIENLRIFADILNTSTENTTQHQLALKRLKDKGYDPLNGSVEDFIELKEREMLMNIALEAFDKKKAEALTKETNLTNQLTQKRTELSRIDRSSFKDKMTITGEAVAETAEEQFNKATATLRSEILALETSLAVAGVNVETIKAAIKKEVEDFAKFLEDNSFSDLILGDAGEVRERVELFESELSDAVTGVMEVPIDFGKFLFEEDNLSGLKDQLSDARDSAIRLHEFFTNQLNESFKETKMLVDAIGTAFGALETVSMSYHENELARLQAEKENITQNTALSQSERQSALANIEKQEREAQIKKIKAERDFMMIKQGLMLAETIMETKKFAQEQALNVLRLKMMGAATISETQLSAAKNIAAGQMSIGQFMSSLGPLGIAAFAASIGGVIASIISARRQAKQQISSLTGASAVGGGGGAAAPPPAAPDFNIVGASPTSQLAETIATAEQQPIKAFVVSEEVTTAQQLDRNIINGASLG